MKNILLFLCLTIVYTAHCQIKDNTKYRIEAVGKGYLNLVKTTVVYSAKKSEAWAFQHVGGNSYNIVYRQKALPIDQFLIGGGKLFVAAFSTSWDIVYDKTTDTYTATFSNSPPLTWKISAVPTKKIAKKAKSKK